MSRPYLDYKPPKTTDERDFVLDNGVVKKGSSVLYKLGAASDVDPTSLPLYKLSVSQLDDQRQFGSCTSFAVSTMYEQLMGAQVIQLSPMFNYTNSRILDGEELTADPGTTLQTACGNLRLAGICKEVTWPYTQANFGQRPSVHAYQEASLLAGSIDYVSLARTVSNIKVAVGIYGYLVSIGFIVGSNYESAETTSTGDIQMEDINTMTVIGGHALNICGWDDARQRFVIVNNYGASWGVGGYGSIPYEYVMSPDLTPEIKTFVPRESFQSQLSRFMSPNPDYNGAAINDYSTRDNLPLLAILFLIGTILLVLLLQTAWSIVPAVLFAVCFCAGFYTKVVLDQREI